MGKIDFSSRPMYVDAFAGAGGMSLGMLRAGFSLALAFDIDRFSVETMRRNHASYISRIQRLDINCLLANNGWEEFGIRPGDVEVVVGGPPCQGFSIQRIGADADDRNKLVHSFMDLVAKLRPRYFLMENVPGLAGGRGKELLNEAIQRIQAEGYLTNQKVLDASDFGVPQRRRRQFVLGELSNSVFMTVKFPQPTRRKVTVREAIGHLPPPPVDGSSHVDYPLHRRDRLSHKNLLRIRAITQGQGRKDLPQELLADCHKRPPEVIGHRNVYGRMRWDELSPTITARFDSFTRGQFGHPEQDRSISLLEGAILQTFPQGYEFCGSKVDIARQIGNAVPPLMAEAFGREIISAARSNIEI